MVNHLKSKTQTQSLMLMLENCLPCIWQQFCFQLQEFSFWNKREAGIIAHRHQSHKLDSPTKEWVHLDQWIFQVNTSRHKRGRGCHSTFLAYSIFLAAKTVDHQQWYDRVIPAHMQTHKWIHTKCGRLTLSRPLIPALTPSCTADLSKHFSFSWKLSYTEHSETNQTIPTSEGQTKLPKKFEVWSKLGHADQAQNLFGGVWLKEGPGWGVRSVRVQVQGTGWGGGVQGQGGRGLGEPRSGLSRKSPGGGPRCKMEFSLIMANRAWQSICW